MADYVYLMASPSLYKIGVSYSPWDRTIPLQKKFGCDFTLYAMVLGGRRLERAVHDFFAEHALGRECFEPRQNIRHWFVSHRNFVDPGVRYFPNRVPQYRIEAGERRTHGDKSIGPATMERVRLRTGLDLPKHWARNVVIAEFGTAVRNPNDIPKKEGAGDA